MEGRLEELRELDFIRAIVVDLGNHLEQLLIGWILAHRCTYGKQG